MGGVLPPLHSPYAALKAMQFPPQQKPGKLHGASVKPFKEISPPSERLPSAPCRRSGLPFAGFWVAGRIALPLLIPISALKDEHRTSNIEHPTSNEKTTTQSSSKYSVNPRSTVEVAIRALPQERFAFCRVLGSGPDCTASFGLR